MEIQRSPSDPSLVNTRLGNRVALGLLLVGLAWAGVAEAQEAPAEAEPEAAAEPQAEPAPAPVEALGSPVAPSAAQRSAAHRLANLHIDELALQREQDAASQQRLLAVALYTGGVALSVASVSMLVVSALQGACVAEADLGCYDVPEYIIGGLGTAVIAAVLMSGATFADRRASYLDERAREHEDELDERRRTLERQVGLAVGPTSVRLTLTF